MKLRHKTILFVMPMIIIPILLVGYAAIYKLRQSAEERLNAQVETLLQQISQNLSNKIASAEASLLLLSDAQLVKQYSLTSNEQVRYELLLPNLLGVFKSLQSSVPDYYEIKFVMPDGYEDVYWASDEVNNLNNTIAGESYFQDLRESNEDVFKRIIFDENTKKYALLIAQKLRLSDPAVDVYGAAPALRGYIVITVSLDYLQAEINRHDIGVSGFLSVMDSHGKIIFYRNENHASLLDSFVSYSPGAGVQNMFNSESYFDAKIGDVSVSIHSMEMPLDLYLLGILPRDEVMNIGRELARLVFIITIVAVIIAMLFVFIALRQLVLRPISNLNAAAQEIGNGNLDLSINVGSNDEIGSLAKAFMEMSRNLKRTHEEVSYTANHDGLTGLPNRAMFQEYLTRVLLTAKQYEKRVALLFLDLDDFKRVNDSMGHQAGDVLLQEIARRLSGSLRKKENPKNRQYNKASDLVARLGGDEFIILLNEVEGPFDATAVADRILKNFRNPVKVLGHDLYANCSIGITLYPDDGMTANDLIKNADIAMYHAKEQGKNHYQFYSEKLNTDMQKRLQINSRLRVALERSGFKLHYQPKVDLGTGKIIGLEALLRWNDAELGEVSPASFIPVAEESGLITPITEWVFNEVCKQCVKWKSEGVGLVPVAVNVSSIQFKRNDLVAIINTSLQRSGIDPEYIEIELTETSLLSDAEDAIEILNGLNRLGISVALDDFGTGYSSLSYLNQLPIDTLKIDRSFVKDIVEINHDYPVIDAIIALGHALDLSIVAEGVETAVQLKYLETRSCDVLQGYLISRPMPAEVIPELLGQCYFGKEYG